MITNILNVKINTENKAEILQKVELLLQDKKQHYIVTPNPEIVLASLSDFDYLKILNNADIQICDGFGLKLASYFTENRVLELIKGVDFIKDICQLAVQKKCSMFLLGSVDNTAFSASKKLKAEFPELNIVGAHSGGKVDLDGNLQDLEILAKIKEVEPDILFVGFGHPKQEKFIDKYLKDLPSVKLAIAVGGSFDLISGNLKRAPKIFRSLNIEWLYRLIIQPSRIKRIYDAVIRFPYIFLKWRFRVRPVYRQSILLCIFNEKNQVIITKRLHRGHDKFLNNLNLTEDHWQLPQGGMEDNDDLEKATRREAREELSISSIEILGYSRQKMKYLWSIPVQLFYRKMGQEQTVAYVKFTGDEKEIVCDNRECSDYKWVNFDQLLESVHLVRKERANFAINEFNNKIK